MEKELIVTSCTLPASAAQVWQALTEKDQMKEWYFDLEEFRAEPGFRFQFTGGTEDRTYLHLCEVTEAAPNQKLAYSWRYEGYSGNSEVTFELFPESENSTLLRLTHAGVETFPESNPDLARENFVGGWEHIICNSLPAFLENKGKNTT